MAAGILENDNAIYHEEAAWHGLGIVVKGADAAPTPRGGLKQIGAEWEVEQRVLFTYDNFGNVIEVPTHVGNYRADKGNLLGVVSTDYEPIQNVVMADFCEALLAEAMDTVRCESIGTLYNGKRVWFLLKGKDFAVANGDGIFPYICVSNGHDGKSAFRVTPTTIRVVCKNTLGMVVPEFETGKLGDSAFMVRHIGDVRKRVEEARLALKHYGKTLEENKKLADTLANKPVTSEEVQAFFLACYTADFGDIPANPKDKREESKVLKSQSAFNSFAKRFDDERSIAGASWWNAFNAYSGLVQHDQKARGKDDVVRVERRVDSNLFGLAQDRTQAALKRAFKAAIA
jgi:phage/plasmid-like protein (TIGR03299 family)